jgi:hypothetical protein
VVPPQARSGAVTERFKPGGVVHALASGLLELALAALLLAGSLLLGDGNPGAAAALQAAAILWTVLALYSLVIALLRARVLSAELDDEAVILHGIGGARRYRYSDLTAVEVSRGRTRLVRRDGRAHTVRGLRGAAQGNRFRSRVLARATEAAARRVPDAGGGPGRLPDSEEATEPEEPSS